MRTSALWIAGQWQDMLGNRKGGLVNSPKSEVASMLKALPEDASLEDIQLRTGRQHRAR